METNDPHAAMSTGQIVWHIVQFLATTLIGVWFKYELSQREISHKKHKKKHRK